MRKNNIQILIGGFKIESLKKKKYWIWLSTIKGVGSIKKQILLDVYKNPEKIYNLSKEEIIQIKGFNEKLANNITDEKNKNNIQKQMDIMLKENIKIITIEDKEYPQILKTIYDYPICIFVKGNIDILNKKAIGIVGCRNSSLYGEKVAQYFSYNLAKKGLNIISGLARGIDSYAHIGAIKAKGSTIGIIGCGLDTVYPKENQYLYDKIISEDGAIISEYPLGIKPEKINFPARNRIISGMSKGVLIVEAKRRSGALITVDFALEQGREVFVVPGNIDELNSVGTNNLIKQGAQIVTTYRDIEI